MTFWFKQLLANRFGHCDDDASCQWNTPHEGCRWSKDNTQCKWRKKHMKAREQKFADREVELIDIAHSIVDAEGFAGLTMDKLVSHCNYSKGTVYNHFSCKEDLFTALSLSGIKNEKIMLGEARRFDGNTRERALALNYAFQLYSRLEPTLSQCILHAKSPSVIEKSSPTRLAQLQQEDGEIMTLCDQIFVDAVQQGDLKLSPGLGVESFTFVNWALALGTNTLLTNGQSVQAISRIDQRYALLRNLNILYDGMNWKPLSTEFDFFKTWDRLDQFFDEYIQLLQQYSIEKSS